MSEEIREDIYLITHRFAIPAAHAILWIVAYIFNVKYISTFSAKEWFPVVREALVCVVFFTEVVITLMDIYFAHPKRTAKMTLFVPFAILLGLLTVVFLLFIVYLTRQTENIVLIIFCVAASGKFMEIWLQNNVFKFVANNSKTLYEEDRYTLHFFNKLLKNRIN